MGGGGLREGRLGGGSKLGNLGCWGGGGTGSPYHPNTHSDPSLG